MDLQCCKVYEIKFVPLHITLRFVIMATTSFIYMGVIIYQYQTATGDISPVSSDIYTCTSHPVV